MNFCWCRRCQHLKARLLEAVQDLQAVQGIFFTGCNNTSSPLVMDGRAERHRNHGGGHFDVDINVRGKKNV